MQNPITPGFVSTGRFLQIDFMSDETLRFTMTVATFIEKSVKNLRKKICGYFAPFAYGRDCHSLGILNDFADKILTKTDQKNLTLCREQTSLKAIIS